MIVNAEDIAGGIKKMITKYHDLSHINKIRYYILTLIIHKRYKNCVIKLIPTLFNILVKGIEI